MKLRYLIIVFVLSISGINHAQNPRRFQNEIDTIERRYINKVNSPNLILFTGSSSIRRWQNIQDYFPGKNIINTGFGGSNMSDLLFYIDTLIIKYKPVQVFIYEGDNDIAAGKKAEDIIKEAEYLCKRISTELPGTQTVIFSVKPSPLRWDLKDEYITLNKMYSKMSSESRDIKYVDVWTPLLDQRGFPKKEIFISDSLHLNRLGYDIWAPEIRKIIR
jgi:lysophospholipase L1-like esterase